MRHVPRTMALALMFWATPAWAQPLVETIEVRLVSVDVVVVDRDGNTVGGLRPEDFIVRDDGRERVITNFSELHEDRRVIRTDFDTLSTEPLPGAEIIQIKRPEPRKIVLVMDYLRLLDRPNREAYFRSLRDFVQDAMRPEDEATVVEWRGGGFMTTVPFTRDEGPIIEALNRIERDASVRFGIPWYEYQDASSTYAPAYDVLDLDREVFADPGHATQRAYERVRRRVDSIRAILAGLSGIEGRKIMVLSMQRFPLRPGIEYGYADWQYNTRPLMDDLVRDANAASVTLHAFWAEGLGKSGPSAEYAEAGMGRSAGDDYRIAQTNGAGVETVALRTGGRSASGGVAAGEKLTEALAQLDHSYSIAWKAEGEADGKPRKIEINVRQKGLRVIHRASYVEKSFEQTIEDRLMATALFSPQPSKLQPTIGVGRPSPAGRSKVVVPIDVMVPMSELTLLPIDRTHQGGFRVYLIPVNQKGELDEMVSETQAVEIPSEGLDDARTTHATLRLELEVHERSPRVAIAVVDAVTREAGYVVARLPVP